MLYTWDFPKASSLKAVCQNQNYFCSIVCGQIVYSRSTLEKLRPKENDFIFTKKCSITQQPLMGKALAELNTVRVAHEAPTSRNAY